MIVESWVSGSDGGGGDGGVVDGGDGDVGDGGVGEVSFTMITMDEREKKD